MLDTGEWRTEAGKEDCWGNTTWWRVYRDSDYWDYKIVTGKYADAQRVARCLAIVDRMTACTVRESQ